jgi:hypothetical protein
LRIEQGDESDSLLPICAFRLNISQQSYELLKEAMIACLAQWKKLKMKD